MSTAVMPTATDRPPLVGVVLAGGASRRMGRDKALLAWHGEPLIAHQLALLEACGVDTALVSGERPAWHGIADARANGGPVAGIAGILAARSGDLRLLVIPVDMPLLQSALLQRLRDREPDAPCLRFAGKVLPFRLRVDARCRAELDAHMASGAARERSLRALQQAVGLVEIPLQPHEAVQLTDCNTPETWEEATS